jgi:hypothetical protein
VGPVSISTDQARDLLDSWRRQGRAGFYRGKGKLHKGGGLCSRIGIPDLSQSVLDLRNIVRELPHRIVAYLRKRAVHGGVCPLVTH